MKDFYVKSEMLQIISIRAIFCMFVPPLSASVPRCSLHQHFISLHVLVSLQLRLQVEGWAERVSELEAEMRRREVAYSGMQQDVANKDERIMVWLG